MSNLYFISQLLFRRYGGNILVQLLGRWQVGVQDALPGAGSWAQEQEGAAVGGRRPAAVGAAVQHACSPALFHTPPPVRLLAHTSVADAFMCP